MSTRAIAPIVGVHHDTVASDVRAVGNPTPAETVDRQVRYEDGEWAREYEPIPVNPVREGRAARQVATRARDGRDVADAANVAPGWHPARAGWARCRT